MTDLTGEDYIPIMCDECTIEECLGPCEQLDKEIAELNKQDKLTYEQMTKDYKRTKRY